MSYHEYMFNLIPFTGDLYMCRHLTAYVVPTLLFSLLALLETIVDHRKTK
jgi:hypothetical protein